MADGKSADPISLIEEFVLLLLEDEGGELDVIPDVHLHCGLAGAALMALSFANRVDSDLHAVWVADPRPTGQPALDHVLQLLADDPGRHDAKTWIERLAKQGPLLLEQALASLCARGILTRTRDEHRHLWALKTRRYPVVKGRERLEAKRRILALLDNDDIPSPEDVALVALASACFVFERILSAEQLADCRPRIDQIERMDLIGGEIPRTARRRNIELKAAERRTIVAGLAGNVMEWFDFGVYGYFAATIGRQFFPANDPSMSLVASFGVFAVGFVARPIGAAIFGYLGDRFGRRLAVMTSVVLMVIPTVIMGLLPTYATVGLAAPFLLIVMRLLQGIAVGGEYTTSMVLLVESAEPGRRGFLGSFAPLGSLGGLLLGAVVGAGLLAVLSPEVAADWGWRLAFLFGVVIGLVVWLVRRRLPRDKVVVSAAAARQSPLVEALRTEWRTIIRVIFLGVASAAGFFTCLVFISTWLQQTVNVSPTFTLTLNGAVLLILGSLVPLAGRLSDVVGRRNQIAAACLALAVLAFPLFWLMKNGGPAGVILAPPLFALPLALLFGATPALLVELFPRHLRCSGLSIGFNVSMSVFGGTVPLVAVLLISWTGNVLAPSWYLALAAVVTAITVVATREPEPNEV